LRGRVGGKWRVGPKEVEMSLKKVLMIVLLVFGLAVSWGGSVFSQGGQSKTSTLAGVIQWVSWDYKYLSLPSVERSIPIPPDTKVVDEQGKSMRLNDLRKGLNIVMEWTRNPDGTFQRKIIVKQ
jgi:hypothetical protein